MKLETIYKKTKTGATQEWTIEVVGNKYRTHSGQVGGAITTNEWTIVYGKNEGKANATTDSEQCMKEAVAKRTKKLESGYFENIKHIHKQQYFEPMLASKWEDSKDKITYPIFSQPKLDGIRCIVTKDGMFSRNGKPIISAPHIRESLSEVFDVYPDMILDGELYADKFANDFNKIVSLVKKSKPTDADLKESKKNIQYWIYDLPDNNIQFGDRCDRLHNLFNTFDSFSKHCIEVETTLCMSEDDVMDLYEGYVDAGFEGKDKITYPIFSQPKLDGIRCIVTKDGMFSRNGKPIISAPHIRESLSEVFDVYPDMILDGELYADKFANDFNKIVSLVKKSKPTDADLKESKKNIQYWIYDLPDNNIQFGDRCDRLHNLFNTFDSFSKHCIEVETTLCMSEDDVMDLYEGYVDAGFEGQMLRLNGKYENKRSKNLMKHKSFIDEEYTIKGIVEGEGNRTGTAGYMVFETADGKPFKSNVKGTWEETAEMLKNKKKLIGKQATIKYFNLTPDGIPRFPYVINIDRESYE